MGRCDVGACGGELVEVWRLGFVLLGGGTVGGYGPYGVNEYGYGFCLRGWLQLPKQRRRQYGLVSGCLGHMRHLVNIYTSS